MFKLLKLIYTNSPERNVRGVLKNLHLSKNDITDKGWDASRLNENESAPLEWKNKEKTGYGAIDFSDIEFFDENILADIEGRLQGTIAGTNYLKCEMTYKERAFLNGIIRKTKPKTVVEIGLSAGGSTSVILNAIRDVKNAKLYSFDYNANWYRDETKRQDNGRRTGFLAHQIVPDLLSKWELFTGGVACQYLKALPEEGVDLCFIDTAHFNPGEHLNILEIFPFLKKNGILIYHDTAYHTLSSPSGSTTCVSLNTLNGKRIVLNSKNRFGLPNIGAIVLDEEVDPMLYGLFSNLSLPWNSLVLR